jgi:hypothetical protein
LNTFHQVPGMDEVIIPFDGLEGGILHHVDDGSAGDFILRCNLREDHLFVRLQAVFKVIQIGFQGLDLFLFSLDVCREGINP